MAGRLDSPPPTKNQDDMDASDDSDDSSIASTLDEKFTDEDVFLVEDILAEGYSRSNSRQEWLVSWAGYELHEATWEPEENINGSPQLLETWKATKAKQDEGLDKPFDVKAWRQLVRQVWADKAARHRRRNLQRMQRGKETTIRYGDPECESEPYYLGPGETDDEDEEDDGVPIIPPPRPSAFKTNRIVDPSPAAQKEKRKGVKSPIQSDNSSSVKNHTQQTSTPTRAYIGSTNASSISRNPPSTSTPTQRDSQGSSGAKRVGLSGTAPSNKPLPAEDRIRTSTLKASNGKTSNTGLTAKRSAPTAMGSVRSTAGNIFAGGVLRRKRRPKESLDAGGPEKRLFTTKQTERKAELGSRNREDRAPPEVPFNLFPIRRDPDANAPKTDGATGSNSKDDGGPKRRKSVRFTEDTDDTLVQSPAQITEPMDIDQDDESLFVPSRKMSLPEYQQTRVSAQSMERRVIFGPEGAKEVSVVFEGISQEHRQVHQHFPPQTPIRFSHTCHVGAIIRFLKEVTVSPGMPAGSISPTKEPEDLNLVTKKLRLGDFGVVAQRGDVAILIYAKSEAWNPVTVEAESFGLSTIGLRYRMLRPIGGELSLCMAPERPLKLPSYRQHFYSSIYNASYFDLLPPSGRTSSRPLHFFLVFPNSPNIKKEALKALCHWLRECSPDCNLYLSFLEGHWASFLKLLTSNDGHLGCVIVHESQVRLLRQIDGFSKLLNVSGSGCSFWCFSEGLMDVSLFPSSQSRVQETDICLPQFTNILACGYAVLLTPSFLVTEPRLALEILSWYKTISAKPIWTVVVSTDISEFLESLALDKAKRRADLPRLCAESRASFEVQEALRRLRKEDIEAWATLSNLVKILLEHCNPESILPHISPTKERFPFTFADASIHPNDEQSLVNWFGWWTTKNMDKFRRTHILGSSIETAASCYVSMPDYHTDMKNSEEALAGPGSPKKEALAQVDDPDIAHSTLLPNYFINRLEACFSLPKKRPPMILYKFPVSYFAESVKMQDLYDDFAARSFRSMMDWWEFLGSWRRSPEGRNPYLNTYVGFFYTMTCDWSTELIAGNRPKTPPSRHPWIAIYRPVDPHTSSWFNTELFIIDLGFHRSLPERQEIYEGDLSHAQRWLIKLVKERTDEKLANSCLERVWIKGHEMTKFHEANYLEGTFSFLETMVADFKSQLPPLDFLLEKGGYVKLRPGPAPSAPVPSRPDPDHMDIDEPGKNGSVSFDHGRYLVFQPPRVMQAQPPAVRNALYDAAVQARKENVDCDGFGYTYQPTMEWYDKQRKEGRGFEHIKVHAGDWDTMKKMLKYKNPSEVSQA